MWKSDRKLYLRNWRRNHRKSINKGVVIWFTNRRLEVIKKLGGKCARCGFSDKRALQIDHIKGGGSKENRKLGWLKMYKKILLDDGSNYQLLCANCNWIKRNENREHIKKFEKKYIKNI